MNISDTESPTACHKVSSGSHSNESGTKVILLQALLVWLLLTELSPGQLDGSCFCDMINYALELLAMFGIYGDMINETYVWFEILEIKIYINEMCKQKAKDN